jgi:hypothetical protein
VEFLAMAMVSDGVVNMRRHFALWWWLYLAKLLLALVITLPLLAVTDAVLSTSAFGGALLRSWSVDVLAELILTQERLLPVFVLVLFSYSALVFLFKQFINGGIYTSLLAKRPLGRRQFFAESAAGLRGNLKISLIMAVIYLLLAVVSQTVAEMFPADLFGNFGWGTFLNLFVHWAFLYLFLIAGSVFSDLLRLHLAAQPESRLLKRLKTMLVFYRSRFVKLNGVYYLYFVPLVIIWLLIEKLALAITGGLGTMVGVILELALLQFCSWLRTGQSLLFSATAAPMLRDAFPGQVIAGRGETESD